jgi:hypothetical protein
MRGHSAAVFAMVVLACFVCASQLAAWQTSATGSSDSFAAPTPSRSSLKDQLVFVRADPSLGVSSTVSIAETNGNTGSVSGRHSAPVFQPTSASNPKSNEIALMKPDGSAVKRLNVYGSDPSLSPDGNKIAYCSIRETLYSQIYVMNSDATSQKRLTNINTGDACGPVWSHDGKILAFYAFALTNPRRNPEIWVMDADGSNQKRLTDHGIDPAWSTIARLSSLPIATTTNFSRFTR